MRKIKKCKGGEKMNKKRLKKWVINALIVINMLCLVLIVWEMNNIVLFTISKVICIIIYLLNSYLLYKYSDIFKD